MKRIPGCAAFLALMIVAPGVPCPSAVFAEEPPAGSPGTNDPAVITGTIYAKEAEPKKALYTFRRTAARSGSTVRVLREFIRPDGTVAARERVVYEAEQFVSYELEELQSGARGKATVRADPGNPRERKIFFEYSEGDSKKTGVEKLENDTVINDTVAPFIEQHWGALLGGAAVKFRFVAIGRAETVGFKLTKSAETTWRNQPVIVLKMEPTSFIIARFVEPLVFIVEKEGAHRVLQYTGRTTPGVRKGNDWEDLEALTVFDWK